MPSSSWARRCAGLALALLVLPTTSLGLVACQSEVDPSASSPERPSRDDAQATLASHPVETRTRIHRVFGRLPDARRKAVRAQVGSVVDAWWEASYLGGSYPRSDFPQAFPGFTKAAERRARSDKALLTNQTQGPRIDSVSARHRMIALDILATDRQARSATASFVLKFETGGELVGTTTVRGRLFLVRRDGEWRIFGYDVAKGSTR
ncbi:hypothetical protein EUA93_18990 [Nocardioides oleivorans]|uniref:Nuclear transport factor 2 family protein n=1 Tax=Nocardioides oleivorans TaxID=273676 RepID=A0A4Q2RPZ8_9ACTN|nr:hypothetical protein [Nocardioides oleivorans]RYB91020.1 hypothetical protein EUA93_18990 [Nocardioides oleivorans]